MKVKFQITWLIPANEKDRTHKLDCFTLLSFSFFSPPSFIQVAKSLGSFTASLFKCQRPALTL